MEKTGDVKTLTTRCDYCGDIALEIDEDGHALCARHAAKTAESSPAGEDWVLKSIADRLAARQDLQND